MAHGLSSEQMHKIARSMSDKGRNGDSELVHVMPEEVSLLERIGAGTTNPYTGNHGEPQGTTGKHREPQGTTGNHRELQGTTGSHREAQ